MLRICASCLRITSPSLFLTTRLLPSTSAFRTFVTDGSTDRSRSFRTRGQTERLIEPAISDRSIGKEVIQRLARRSKIKTPPPTAPSDALVQRNLYPRREPPTLDASSLPRLRGPRIRFASISLTEDLPYFFKASNRGYTPISVRSNHFTVRSLPTSSLPPRDNPFRPAVVPSFSASGQTNQPILSGTFAAKHPNHTLIRFGIIATKSHVSKFATERNRSKNRMKAALDLALNRSNSSMDSLVSPDLTYIAILNPTIYEAPFEELVKEVYEALVKLRGYANRGGRSSSHGTRVEKGAARNHFKGKDRSRQPQQQRNTLPTAPTG